MVEIDNILITEDNFTGSSYHSDNWAVSGELKIYGEKLHVTIYSMGEPLEGTLMHLTKTDNFGFVFPQEMMKEYTLKDIAAIILTRQALKGWDTH